MNEKKVQILEAKGRPMLNWVGKKPLDYIKSFPAQLVEVFDPEGKAEQIENPTFDKLKDSWQNLIFHGDNKEIAGFLLANGFRGKIDLVYIDPPFDSGANYVRKVELRGRTERTKVGGEDYTIGEQIQYHDIWANDNYLQFMYERLLLIKETLKSDGVVILHCDWRKSHHLRCVLDEVFGGENFINEITVKMSNPKNDAKRTYGVMTEKLLIYAKGENYNFNILKADYGENYLETEYKYQDNKRKYATSPLTSRQPTDPFYDWKGNKRRWRVSIETMKELEKADLLHYTEGNIPRKKRYLEDNDGRILQDYWDDVGNYQTAEYSDYPTAKPLELLMRVINTFSGNHDIIFDCFMGSGTTQAVAQQLGRRWIGCDINKGAIQTTSKRLQKIVLGQIRKEKENGRQKKLDMGEKGSRKYYPFTHYKVNDYDLQLLRTEAIELAVQHIGIQRVKTDSFFEGLLGKNLVKIIDFNHPLTLLDLQMVQDELKKRPDENRNITIVCLGKELVVDPWIEDYNKKHPVNKIEVIELRTDSKYGKFLIHKPTEAKVDIKRKEEKCLVEIKEFISPSIIERLDEGEKLVKAKIPDFRSMIDVVLIDKDYDGKVFNITFSDVPEKKNDLVKGKYEIDIKKNKATVAVKIIDMLGEEILVTKEI